MDPFQLCPPFPSWGWDPREYTQLWGLLCPHGGCSMSWDELEVIFPPRQVQHCKIPSWGTGMCFPPASASRQAPKGNESSTPISLWVLAPALGTILSQSVNFAVTLPNFLFPDCQIPWNSMKGSAWEITTQFIKQHKSALLGFVAELWTKIAFQLLPFLHKSPYVLPLTVEFYIKTSKKGTENVCCIFIGTVHTDVLILWKRSCNVRGIKFRSIILDAISLGN